MSPAGRNSSHADRAGRRAPARVLIWLAWLGCSLGLVAGSAAQAQDISSADPRLDLLPWPQNIQQGAGSLSVPSPVSVSVDERAPELIDSVERLLLRWEASTAMELLPSPQTAGVRDEGQGPWLTISIADGQTAENTSPEQSTVRDESYTLSAGPAGVVIEAASAQGARWGLATLEQLLDLGHNGFAVPFVRIEDAPRFSWRGLLLDSCRHWLPKELVLRTLEAMASVKMNVLHWHLTEDQAFRIESKRYPRLHQLGSGGNYYTQDDVREVIELATRLGIRVIPEFDVPGHTTSWLVAYPDELSPSGPTWQLATTYGVQRAALDPTRESTYELLEGFFAEMAQLFPDPVVHIGGDEVNGAVWEASPSIVRFMTEHGLADPIELQAHFTRRVQKILMDLGKTPMVWDEALHADLDPSVIVQSWRGSQTLRAAVARGHQTVLSGGYYLDLMLSAADHYAVDPQRELNASSAAIGPDDPLLLGGEACLWTELVSEVNAESRLWPRTAAIAERLWSRRDLSNGEDLYRRLDAFEYQLDGLGVAHRSYQDQMLADLMGGLPTAPLRTLIETLEPVRYYARHGSRHYTTLTPLNRLVDAAYPESRAARHLQELVSEALTARHVTDLRDLRDLLLSWRAQRAQLAESLTGELAEIAPLSRALAELAELGLEALDVLAKGNAPSPDWLRSGRATLSSTMQPHAELTIAVAPGIRRLVEEASSQPPRR